MRDIKTILEQLLNKHLPDGVDRIVVDIIKRKGEYSVSDLIFVVDDKSPLLEIVEGQDNTKYYLRFDLIKSGWILKYESITKKYLGIEIYPNSNIAVMKKSIYENTYHYSR